MKTRKILFSAIAFLSLVYSGFVYGQTAFSMSSGNYNQNFANIANVANFGNNFIAAGTDDDNFGVAVAPLTALPSAPNQTTVFSTTTGGGVQRGTANILLLATGTVTPANAAAFDLYLDFSNRNAGTISLDWAQLINGTGNRGSDFTVQANTGASNAFEVISGSAISVVNNVALSGTLNITLPAGLNGKANARIRFYLVTNAIGTTGSRPKLSIDNLNVTSTAMPIVATWEADAWSNTSGPTASIDAIIRAPFSTTALNQFTAKNITIDTGGSLTINPGHNISLSGSINNTLSADKFVVASNANLIQTGVATNTGNIFVQRSTTIRRLDYTYWSSPVSGQTLVNLSPATLSNRFYGLDFSNVFVQLPNSTTMISGVGYSVRAPNNFTTTPSLFTADFIGGAISGTQTVSVPASTTDYRFLGNPYPCTINATAFQALNPGALYFWTHSVQGAGAGSNYASFTTIGTAASASPALGGTPNGTIQVGQGFMFVASTLQTAITFNNGMKLANNADQFFRTAQPSTAGDKLWLNLTQDDNFSQILVGYVPTATNGFDASIDARQINTTGLVLYSIISDNNLVIQGRPDFNAADVVNLGFKSAIAGNQTIAIDHTEGVFSSGQNIYLKDNLTNVVHNLSNGAYTFATEIGTFNNRFTVLYNTTLSNASIKFDANNIVVFRNGNDLNITSGNIQMKTVKIIDLQGRVVFEKNNVDSNIFSTDHVLLKNQVGIVQITSDSNETVSKKVIF